MGERLLAPHGVDAPDEAPEPFERVAILELRGAPAAARKDREPKTRKQVQRASFVNERCDHGNFARGELGGKCMLLEDRGLAPARGPVELGDDRCRILDADLVDAVLVARECQHPAVAQKPHGLEGIEHAVGREARVRMGGIGHGERFYGARICPFAHSEEPAMKNPLDTLWGTVITGLVLTAVLYFFVAKMMGA